jgi:hypothetical protein
MNNFVKKRSGLLLGAAISAAVFGGCVSGSDDAFNNAITGTWKYSYTTLLTTSIHFQNNGVRSTRSVYVDLGHDLDSTSCYPDYSSNDSLTDNNGEWTFYSNGKYIHRSIFRFPTPVGNKEPVVKYDSTISSGDYEIKGDSLKLIFSRIGDKYAWTLMLLKFSEKKDSLYLLDPVASYVDGNCAIASYYVDPLSKEAE